MPERHPSREDIVELIRARLGPGSARRVGVHHVDVVDVMRAMADDAPDVQAIYKALMDSGRPMVMTRLYRVLKVLEEAGLVDRRWLEYQGRPRGVYSLVDRRGAQARTAPAAVCAQCGAALAPHMAPALKAPAQRTRPSSSR
jgi:Fe2+ or Zn2+ uptake regulation protein